MSVGMLMTSNRRARSGFSSTLSLPMRSLPACSVAISLRIGSIILHGPHHSAQKATMTGSPGPPISSSNVAFVSVTVFAAISGAPLGSPVGGRLVHVLGGVAARLQPSFGVDRRHASAAGGGDPLPVGVVLHVTAGEDPRDVRARAPRLGL